MNFSELKEELYARGTDYLSEDAAGVARAERWINQAYREILGTKPWPFLKAIAVGNAGVGFVSIPDLKKVLTVTADGVSLQRAIVEELIEDGDLAATGTPGVWYLSDGTTITGYPLGGTLTARYIKRLPPMTGTDEPIFDEEYHDLIIDGAMTRVYKDDDNFEAAAALQSSLNARLNGMIEDYFPSAREPTYISVTPYDG